MLIQRHAQRFEEVEENLGHKREQVVQDKAASEHLSGEEVELINMNYLTNVTFISCTAAHLFVTFWYCHLAFYFKYYQ